MILGTSSPHVNGKKAGKIVLYLVLVCSICCGLAGCAANTLDTTESKAASSASATSPDASSEGEVTEAVASVDITCSVVSDKADGSVGASAPATLPAGSTAIDALAATGLSYRAQSTQYGSYVAAIGDLAEKDSRYGSGCGWIYTVNGASPDCSPSAYVLNDGDAIAWSFVTG